MNVKQLLASRSGIVGITIVALFVTVALFAPLIAPQDPLSQNLRDRLKPPGSTGYPLGTDELGRDILARLIYGARVSLTVTAAALLFGTLIGIPIGLASGFYGGPVEVVLTHIVDVLLSLPRILVAILLVATLGLEFWALVIAIGFPDIPIFARIVRASTLSIKEMDYVTASRVVGTRDVQILARHVLPNLLGPIMVQASYSMAAAILITGGLSFLGLGIRPPTPEWGGMMAEGRALMRTAPHLVTIPGLALAIVILGINLLGDALRQAYDPRFRSTSS
ncbi:MAG TPA: ABC transporter permease [Chloroflexaceae bacterium]|nr:ABC transporter permease [Chloroflexaceae bacterium]